MSWIWRLVLAAVAGVIVYLICILIGGVILAPLGVPIVSPVGAFLAQYAVLFGALAFLWYLATGGGFSLPRPRPPSQGG